MFGNDQLRTLQQVLQPPQMPTKFFNVAGAAQETQKATKFLADFQESSLASAFAERLDRRIKAFDAGLDQDHEVGVRLVSFGQTFTFHVERVAYHNPSLILFMGKTEQGQPVELVQHVSQISFLLMAMPRFDPTKPKQPYGFATAAKQDPVSE